MEVSSPAQAEARAREFIKQKHPKVKRIFFRTMYREGNTWVLHGEVEFKRVYFFVVARSFKLQVNTDREEVISYDEAHPSRSKEAK